MTLKHDIEKRTTFRNTSGLKEIEIAALLKEVQQADSSKDVGICRPTGETTSSADERRWLAKATAGSLVSALRPPYVQDPRDVELNLDVGRKSTRLVVVVRVSAGKCVGYSLSTAYN